MSLGWRTLESVCYNVVHKTPTALFIKHICGWFTKRQRLFTMYISIIIYNHKQTDFITDQYDNIKK